MIIRSIEKRAIGLQAGPTIEAVTDGKYEINLLDGTRIITSTANTSSPGVKKIAEIEQGIVIVELEDGTILTTKDIQPLIRVDLKPLAKVGSDTDDIFKEINEYFKTLSDEKQLAIFKLFEEILDMAIDHSDLQDQFDEKIHALYSYIDYDEILQQLLENGSIEHPETKLNYGVEEPDNGITYITQDYMELCAFAVYLRPMSIIWSTLMDCLPVNIRTNDKKRELYLYKMSMRYSILDRPVMQRLDRYVTTLASDNKVSLGAIMDGLGSEDLKPWLMGFTLLRRVSLFQFSRKGQVKSNNVAANIVSSIYNFLMSKITTAVSSFGSSYRHKRMKRAHGGDGDKVAAFGDNYKITDEVSEGTLAFYDRAIMDTRQYLNIEPTISLTQLNKRYRENTKSFNADEIDFENYLLPQYVLDDIIPLRLLPSLGLDGSGKEMVMAFTATQVILEKWGFHDLASLVLAKSAKIPYNKTYDNIKSRLSFEASEELEKIYPTIIVRDKDKDKLNEGAKAIDAIALNWGNRLWFPHASEVSKPHLTLKKISNGYLIHKEIRNDLAALFIKLNKGI